MNDEKIENKVKMQYIISELTNLKKYNSELFNNTNGEVLENYLNELNRNISKAQNEAENLYTKNFK